MRYNRRLTPLSKVITLFPARVPLVGPVLLNNRFNLLKNVNSSINKEIN